MLLYIVGLPMRAGNYSFVATRADSLDQAAQLRLDALVESAAQSAAEDGRPMLVVEAGMHQLAPIRDFYSVDYAEYEIVAPSGFVAKRVQV